MLVLFSHDCLAAWAIAEGCPHIEEFCEYPGFITLNGTRHMADFWVRGATREQFIKIDGGIELLPELPKQVPTYADVEISLLPANWLFQHRVWIDNWLQMTPYIVSNGSYVTPGMLARVSKFFDAPRPLFEVEHAFREVDAQLVRSAVFMLMHQGKLYSDDLMVRPLGSGTVFNSTSDQPVPARPWPA